MSVDTGDKEDSIIERVEKSALDGPDDITGVGGAKIVLGVGIQDKVDSKQELNARENKARTQVNEALENGEINLQESKNLRAMIGKAVQRINLTSDLPELDPSDRLMRNVEDAGFSLNQLFEEVGVEQPGKTLVITPDVEGQPSADVFGESTEFTVGGTDVAEGERSLEVELEPKSPSEFEAVTGFTPQEALELIEAEVDDFQYLDYSDLYTEEELQAGEGGPSGITGGFGQTGPATQGGGIQDPLTGGVLQFIGAVHGGSDEFVNNTRFDSVDQAVDQIKALLSGRGGQ